MLSRILANELQKPEQVARVTAIGHVWSKPNKLIPSMGASLWSYTVARPKTTKVRLLPSVLEPSNLEPKLEEQLMGISMIEHGRREESRGHHDQGGKDHESGRRRMTKVSVEPKSEHKNATTKDSLFTSKPLQLPMARKLILHRIFVSHRQDMQASKLETAPSWVSLSTGRSFIVSSLIRALRAFRLDFRQWPALEDVRSKRYGTFFPSSHLSSSPL